MRPVAHSPVLLVVLGSLALHATSAQQPATSRRQCESAPLPIILTVEGGGSLGVYEAGMTYLLVDIFKRRWLGAHMSATVAGLPALCLAVATGASAGNINGFLAATDWCDGRLSVSPESSVYWTTWVTTGLTQLFENPRDTVDEKALFSRSHFDGYIQRQLKRAWSTTQWIPGCRTHFGATVTRLYADSVRGAGAMFARSQRMAFALTLEGMRDSAPVMRPFAARPKRYSFSNLKSLPPDASGHIAWADAFRLIETSSGYPLAFKPLMVSYCTLSVPDHGCPDTTAALALDGGVFDNSPVALGYALYYDQAFDAQPTVLFVSPDHRRRHPGQQRRDLLASADSIGKARSPEGLEEVAQLVREAIPTARQYEQQLAGQMLPALLRVQALEELQDAHRALVDSLMRHVHRDSVAGGDAASRLLLAMRGSLGASSADVSNGPRYDPDGNTFRTSGRWHPLSGDWIGGFGAFFGRPLRQYDFYVGLYDGLMLVAENVLCNDRWRATRLAPTAQPPFAAESLRVCIDRSFMALLDDETLPLGSVAPRFMRQLYHDEFDRGPDTPARAWVRSEPLSQSDSILIVMDAVREAMYQVRVMGTGIRPGQHFYQPKEFLAIGHCRRAGIVTGMFCGNGVVAFFDELHRDRDAMAILREWKGAPNCDRSMSEQATRVSPPEDCRVERNFFDMASDPEGSIHALSRRMLRRIDNATPSGGSGRVASALLFVHGTTSDRYRRGWDFGSTSCM
jgi:hypothetical protein